MDQVAHQVLHAHGFGVSFGDRVMLADLEFSLPPHSITALMGPSGSGKSMLLRSLAHLNQANSRYQQWGSVHYADAPLTENNHPPLVQNNAKLLRSTALEAIAHPLRDASSSPPSQLRAWVEDYVQRMGFPDISQYLDQPTMDLPLVHQRAVAILAQAAVAPALLLVDEPASDLGDYDTYLLLELLRAVSSQSSVLVVLHNQRHASLIADHMILLAGGRIQEARPMQDFLNMPMSYAGQQFVRTGSCAEPSLDADPDTLTPHALTRLAPLPQAAQDALQAHALANSSKHVKSNAAPSSTHSGPAGFSWLQPQQIAGTSLPGAVQSIENDLAALQRMGVTTLITLTEQNLPQEPLQRAGMNNLHLPIYDGEAPSMAQIQMLLRRMEICLRDGQVIAVHCLAGLGRTGTVLAAWWIREGLTAHEALRRLRLINPGYVQSSAQEEFLTRYEETILQKII